MTINKTLHVIDGKQVVTTPKTEKSNRTITLPLFLVEELQTYCSRIYGIQPDSRIFYRSKWAYGGQMKAHIKQAGLQPIRLHDLRHSHASLLIELGFSALLVSERLGHENVSTTLNTYAHLFPSKQSEVADKLQKLYTK